MNSVTLSLLPSVSLQKHSITLHNPHYSRRVCWGENMSDSHIQVSQLETGCAGAQHTQRTHVQTQEWRHQMLDRRQYKD